MGGRRPFTPLPDLLGRTLLFELFAFRSLPSRSEAMPCNALHEFPHSPDKEVPESPPALLCLPAVPLTGDPPDVYVSCLRLCGLVLCGCANGMGEAVRLVYGDGTGEATRAEEA